MQPGISALGPSSGRNCRDGPCWARALRLPGMPQATARETAGGGTAYIDFLRLDDSATLRIVETKIGHDEMIVLQGLD